MTKKMKDMTEEEKQKAYAGHRRQWGIDPESDTISKESIAKFCDNFMMVMLNRISGNSDSVEVKQRAVAQLDAYKFMKKVLVGGKYQEEGLNGEI